MKTRKKIINNPTLKKITDILSIIILVILIFTYKFDVKLFLLEAGILLLIIFLSIGIAYIATKSKKSNNSDNQI